jgi:hypothetical protein
MDGSMVAWGSFGVESLGVTLAASITDWFANEASRSDNQASNMK